MTGVRAADQATAEHRVGDYALGRHVMVDEADPSRGDGGTGYESVCAWMGLTMSSGPAGPFSAAVHQATGAVMVRERVTIVEAFALLVARAEAQDVVLERFAERIVDELHRADACRQPV